MFVEFVPACCPGVQQTAEKVLNEPLKSVMQKCYTSFMSDQYVKQSDQRENATDAKLSHKVTDIAPHLMGWLVECYEYVRKNVGLEGGLQDWGYMRCFNDMRLISQGVKKAVTGSRPCRRC